MFACPNCARALTRMQSAAGIFWGCDACGGRTVAIPILRKVVGEAPITRLWAKARSAPEGRKRCPTCGKPMHETEADGPPLDICKLCQFVWFDPREFEQMPAATPLVSSRAELPQAAREAIAVYEAQRLGELSTSEGPIETWQYVPAVFGLPVECDSPSMAGYPAVTWTIALLILVTSIVGFALGGPFINRLSFVPAEALRYGGLTFITSFFLHGGVLHLASNLYFLLIFGDNVEEYLGRIRFAALLLGATIAGGLFHAAGDPRDTLPCVGASGGISGIIVFYALQFPHARLGLFMRLFFHFRWVQFPAWSGLVFWVVLQLIGAAQQIGGFSNVSALAHLGGAVVGLMAWLGWGMNSPLKKAITNISRL